MEGKLLLLTVEIVCYDGLWVCRKYIFFILNALCFGQSDRIMRTVT